MSQEECAAALVVITNEYKRRKGRKIWVKEWLKKRSTLSYIELIKELRSSNGNNDLKNYLRMDEEGFQFLINLIKPHITKKGTIETHGIIEFLTCIEPDFRNSCLNLWKDLNHSLIQHHTNDLDNFTFYANHQIRRTSHSSAQQFGRKPPSKRQ
nr:unnamed protein product [Callosobruchus chinensis]